MLGSFFEHVSSTSFDNAYLAEKPLPGSYYNVAAGAPRVDDALAYACCTTNPSLQLASAPPTTHADVPTPSQAELQPTPTPTLLQASTSRDVLIAASTLLHHNDLRAAHDGADKSAAEGMLGQQRLEAGYSHQLPITTASIDAGSGLAYADYSPHSREPSLLKYPRDNSPTVYRSAYTSPFDVGASSGPHSVASTPAPPKFEMRWGSDLGFLPHGYVPPQPQESIEKVTQDLLHQVECLAAQATPIAEPSPAPAGSSPATTERESRPSVCYDEQSQGSPAVAKPQPRKRRRRTKEENAADRQGQQTHHRGGSSCSSESKQIRNGADSRANGAVAAAAAEPSGRARKGRGKGATGKASPSDVATKWRKLSQTSASGGRENLTDEQKRSNHILSEQKRRNLIKQGFDDLCVLVPDLRCGGYSKSAVLAQAADWLEDLQKGNEELRDMLASLEAPESKT
jgi:hypothetical protein